LMKKLRQILGIAYLESRWIRRHPLWIVQGVTGTAGFIIAMFAWGGNEALRNLAIAYVITAAWSQGLNIIAQDIGWGRIGHDFERLVASPVTLPIYFAGVTIGTTPFMIVMLIPALILVYMIGMDIISFVALLFLSPLALVLGAFTSLSIILRIKNPTNISAITNPLNTVTVSLPPVYYPIGILPPVLREIALIFPTTSLMELGRWIAGGPLTYNPLIPISITLAWLSITAFLVSKRLKWGLE